MAVELTRLYNEMHTDYHVQLLTQSCFDKQIDWIHMVENAEFIDLLHGGELVFNSGLNKETDDKRKDYIEKLIQVQAGGLIIALQDKNNFSEELISFCNEHQFPLFQADWETSYLNIMRRFAETLLENERKEMNLIAAIKNTIYHPNEENLFFYRFEQNGFPTVGDYVISILSSKTPESDYKISNMRKLEKQIQRFAPQHILFEEKGVVILLTYGLEISTLKKNFQELLKQHPSITFHIGTLEKTINDIHRSHQNAWITFRVCEKTLANSVLCYNEIGAYQLLMHVNDPEILYPAFVDEVLGKLIAYDTEHRTDYMDVLKLYFDNNCSITQTANESFYHQNTLKYKIKAIKDILGYDITTNENRVRVMMSLYILKLENPLDM